MRSAFQRVALIATMLMAAGTLTVTAPAASAAPTGCTTVNGANFAESLCTNGTGRHRVVMVQRHFLYPDVPDVHCEGPWMPVGLTSVVDCGFQYVIAVTVQTQDIITDIPNSRDLLTRVPPSMISPRVRVPKPPELATPVPVDCFRQKFEDLIVRVSDHTPAYVFVVDAVFCVNRVANFTVISSFEGNFRFVNARLPQIVSIQNEPGTTRSAGAGQIALQDRVNVRACQDPTSQFCQSFVHNFSGSVSAVTTTGLFEFNPSV